MHNRSVPRRSVGIGTPILMTAVATVGFGLNFWAWGLLASFGPLLRERYGLRTGGFAALMAVPLVLGAVARLPVGVLTDRYGARVMLPAVSLATAVPVFGVAAADSGPLLIAVGCAAGLGGAAFAAGVPIVANGHSYGRRGLALGWFGVGNGGAAVAGVATQWWTGFGGVRAVGLVLGGLLVGHAILGVALVRDVGRRRQGSLLRDCAEALRAATISLPVLYAAAFGVILVLAFYLPSLLSAEYLMDTRTAAWITAAVVAVAAACRPIGGGIADRAHPLPALAVSYLTVGALILVLALLPRPWDPVPVCLALAGIAVSDGIAAGIVLGLLGKAALLDRIGAMAGVTGAIGCLGAVFLVLVTAAVHRLDGSYAAAMTILAGISLGIGWYVRANTARIPLGLALRPGVPPDLTQATLTVALVSSRQPAAVQAISDLSHQDELVVVAGRARPSADRYTLIAGLRAARPNWTFVGLLIDANADADVLDRDVKLIAELLNSGSTPVLITAPNGDAWVAMYLAHRLAANRVVELVDDPTDGVTARPIWIGPKHDPRARVIA